MDLQYPAAAPTFNEFWCRWLGQTSQLAGRSGGHFITHRPNGETLLAARNADVSHQPRSFGPPETFGRAGRGRGLFPRAFKPRQGPKTFVVIGAAFWLPPRCQAAARGQVPGDTENRIRSSESLPADLLEAILFPTVLPRNPNQNGPQWGSQSKSRYQPPTPLFITEPVYFTNSLVPRLMM